MRLDYCFVSGGLARIISKAWVDVTPDGLDHKPYQVALDDSDAPAFDLPGM